MTKIDFIRTSFHNVRTSFPWVIFSHRSVDPRRSGQRHLSCLGGGSRSSSEWEERINVNFWKENQSWCKVSKLKSICWWSSFIKSHYSLWIHVIFNCWFNVASNTAMEKDRWNKKKNSFGDMKWRYCNCSIFFPWFSSLFHQTNL